MKGNRPILILLSIAVLSNFAAELYVPSLPAITDYFHTSSSMVQMTISIYLFSAGFAQLIYGPLSDYYGRKPILLLGILIGVVGGFVCVYASTAYLLLL